MDWARKLNLSSHILTWVIFPKCPITSVIWKWFGFSKNDEEQINTTCRLCRRLVNRKSSQRLHTEGLICGCLPVWKEIQFNSIQFYLYCAKLQQMSSQSISIIQSQFKNNFQAKDTNRLHWTSLRSNLPSSACMRRLWRETTPFELGMHRIANLWPKPNINQTLGRIPNGVVKFFIIYLFF